jgi:hypothetical protein
MVMAKATTKKKAARRKAKASQYVMGLPLNEFLRLQRKKEPILPELKRY